MNGEHDSRTRDLLLINAALDEPAAAAELQQRCVREPELATERAAWLRLSQLLARVTRLPARVNWSRFQQRTSSAMQAASSAHDPALDKALQQAFGAIEQRVDWQRFQGRVQAQVRRSRVSGRRARLWLWGGAVAGLASAAVIAGFLLWPGGLSTPGLTPAGSPAYVRVRFAAPPIQSGGYTRVRFLPALNPSPAPAPIEPSLTIELDGPVAARTGPSNLVFAHQLGDLVRGS